MNEKKDINNNNKQLDYIKFKKYVGPSCIRSKGDLKYLLNFLDIKIHKIYTSKKPENIGFVLIVAETLNKGQKGAFEDMIGQLGTVIYTFLIISLGEFMTNNNYNDFKESTFLN